MVTLGQKLRELRQQKGYKLNDVAQGADLSISFISLIERDKASISVENLSKLANFYNVRLFQIFQDIEEEDALVVNESQLHEWETRRSINSITLFLLSPEDNLNFKASLAMIPPDIYQEIIQLKKGESFITVQEGQLEISLRNKKPFPISQGDTTHFTSFKTAVLKNASQDLPVKLLIVTSASTQLQDKHGKPLAYYEPKI